MKRTPCGNARGTTVLAWLLLSLLPFSSQAQLPSAPTAEKLDLFRADLKATFTNSDGGAGTSGGGPPMMRTLVRLGFHDCASAKCDGCIDGSDTKQNPGLEEMVTVLTPVCERHGLGLADCFAAAASMAVEETSFEGATLAQFPLFFGREDAAACSGFTPGNPEAVFPKAQDGCPTTFGYFKDNFNFTERESVAIIGAHSLGRAEPEGSGFVGAWTLGVNTFDNTFFKDMIKAQLGWKSGFAPGSTMWQWTSTTGNQLMLNSDMCLAKDIFSGTNQETGEPSCTYDACPASPTLAIVQEYAGDNALFVKEFTATFVKMLTKGYDICDLVVVPSKGSGPDFEELYGITQIKQACGAAAGPAPVSAGPMTSGVFDSPAEPVAAPGGSAGVPSGAEPPTGGDDGRFFPGNPGTGSSDPTGGAPASPGAAVPAPGGGGTREVDASAPAGVGSDDGLQVEASPPGSAVSITASVGLLLGAAVGMLLL